MGEEGTEVAEIQYSYTISYSYIQNFATEESIPVKIGEDTSIIAYVYQKDSTPVVPGIASQLIGITELPELKINSNIENAYTEYDGAYYLNVSSYNFINDTDILNSWRKQSNKDDAAYLNVSMYADDHNAYNWVKDENILGSWRKQSNKDDAAYLNVSMYADDHNAYNWVKDENILGSWRKQSNKDDAAYLNVSMYADDHNSYLWHKTSVVTYSYECINAAQYKRDLAAKLYANSAFVSGLTGYALDPYTIAKEAIHRANVLWETLPISWKK